MTLSTQQLPQTLGTILRDTDNQDKLRAMLGSTKPIQVALDTLEALDAIPLDTWNQLDAEMRGLLLTTYGAHADQVAVIQAQVGLALRLLFPPTTAAASVSIAIGAQTAAAAPEEQEPETMSLADMRRRMKRSTNFRFDQARILQLAELIPVVGLEMVDLAGILVRETIESKRGLALVKDQVIADNISTLRMTKEGTISVRISPTRETNLQIVNRDIRRQACAALLTFIEQSLLDDAAAAGALYYRSGASEGAMRSTGSKNVVSSTQGMVAPRTIRERIRSFLVEGTRLMEKQLDATVVRTTGKMHQLITMPAFANAGVVRSFGFTVDDSEDPFEVFLSDPTGEHIREVNAFNWFTVLGELIEYVATYDDSLTDEAFVTSFLPGFADLSDRYCTAVEALARVSPEPLTFARNQIVGVREASSALFAYIGIKVKVGSDGSIAIEASAAVAVQQEVADPLLEEFKPQAGDSELTQIHLRNLATLQKQYVLQGGAGHAAMITVNSINSEMNAIRTARSRR